MCIRDRDTSFLPREEETFETDDDSGPAEDTVRPEDIDWSDVDVSVMQDVYKRQKQSSAKDVFFIGRGIDYAISLEGSLKMKEISYIHSEAYAAGELKHGTISLIEDGTLVIGVLTQPDLYEKTISNMVECKSRGGYLMGLTVYGNYNICLLYTSRCV